MLFRSTFASAWKDQHSLAGSARLASVQNPPTDLSLNERVCCSRAGLSIFKKIQNGTRQLSPLCSNTAINRLAPKYLLVVHRRSQPDLQKASQGLSWALQLHLTFSLSDSWLLNALSTCLQQVGNLDMCCRSIRICTTQDI